MNESELQNALQTQEGLLLNKVSNKIKSKKKTKTRQSKNALANISNERANKQIANKGKDKVREQIVHKHKSSSKYFEVLSKYPKEDNINAPVVILHHRGEKPFQKSKERISMDKKHHLGSDRIQSFKDYKVKKRNESIDNNSQSKCKVKVDENSSLKNIKPSRDKIKNRQIKCALRETPNVIIEQKIKVKKPKPYKQVFPAVDSSSNPNDYIINQMKSLPIRIEDNPLTFMNLFRTANVFNGHKDQKKFDDVMKLYCDKLKHEGKKNLNDSSKSNSKEHLNKMGDTESLRKLYMHKMASLKLLKGANSRKRLKKFKNRSVLLNDTKQYCTRENLENIPESLNSIKSRKDRRRKRTKYLINENSTNNTLIKKLETLFSKENIIPSTIKVNKNSLHYDYLKQNSPNYRPECGDGLVDEFSSQPSSQNNKLSTIYSESITTGMAEKDSIEMDPFVDSTNHGNFKTQSNAILKNDLKKFCGDNSPICKKDAGKISLVEPTVSEDGKKLTFQLVKADFGPKKIAKLNKQLYRIDNKCSLKASKESLPVKKDKLMLFYAERESSCTSKDSLNIAISRDTEMCNNGSSNNVLNVVIKQTKSMLSNSKTAPSRGFDLEKEDYHEINELNHLRKNVCNDGCKNAYENNSEELSFQTYELLAGNQFENSATATNSEELDCKQSILHQMEDNQHKDLVNREFGFCCLQHSPETNKKKSLKNSLINKIFKLKSLPETIEIKNTPCNVPFKNSELPADSKIVSFYHQKNDINCKQQNKFQKNSPKRNKFFTVFNPNGEIESLKKSSTQICHHKTNNEIAIKNKHDIIIQSEPINNYKSSGNNKQNKKDTDNLGLKLQVIGLTKKNSFIKLVESESVENFPNVSKNVNTTAETSQLKKEERNLQLLGNSVNKENKKEYYIPTKQNNFMQNVSDEEDMRKKLSIFKIEKPLKNNNCQIEQKDGLSTESKADNIPILMKKPLIKEEHCEDDFSKSLNFKQNKVSFVSVLPVRANNIVETINNLEASTTTLMHEQVAAKKEEVMVYSEVGVQTDFPTFQNPKKCDIPCEKGTNVPLTNESKSKPMKVTNCVSKNQFFQESNRFENNKMLFIPAKKGSFVHIVKNSNTNKITNLGCGNRPDYKEPVCSSFNKTIQNSLANKDKILSQLKNKTHQTDGQLINKVNAIYEFLQYLDKILKNTALTKQSEICEVSSNNMGNLNKTLRCLCTNCIEILSKIEVNQLTKNQDGKCLKSPEKRFSTQYTKKRSHFVSHVSPQRELEWRKNDESHVEYVNISEVEKPADYGLKMPFIEPKTHKWNPKPFFVVVPSNETFSKNSIHLSGKDVLKQSLLQHSELDIESEFKNVFNSNKLNFQMEDEIDDMLLKKKINNSKLPKNRVNNSEISYNGTQLYEQRFKKYTIDKHNIHDEFTRDFVGKEKIKERECSVNGLYKTNMQNRRLEKCSSSGTLPYFSSKYKNCDKNTFSKVDGTSDNVSSRRGKNLKSVNSDSSLELRYKKTNSFAENNKFIQHDSYVCRNKCFGDSLEYLQSTEGKLSDDIYEQNLDTSKHDDTSSNFGKSFSQYGDGHERKAKYCTYDCDLLRKKEIMVLSRNRQNAKDIPNFFSSNTNHQLKSESCRSSVRKLCKNTTIKNSEKLLTGSVSKNRQSIKLNGLNNKTNKFQGKQNTAHKETVFLRPTNLHEREENSYDENNCYNNGNNSNPSIDSYTCTGSLGKSSVFKNNTVMEKKPKIQLESNYLQNDFSICNNYYVQNSDASQQLMHKSVLKANQEKCKNVLDNEEPILDHHGILSTNVMCSQGEIFKYMETESKKSSKFSLRHLDSNSSIDSLFSQNKETMVFINRKFPCNEGLGLSKNSFDSQKEIQELLQKEEISNVNTVCDSPGWISISSSELHNKNKNAILNSVLSNDLEKVRLQMDIKLNDIMHVEFFCQPSDPVKLSKENNK